MKEPLQRKRIIRFSTWRDNTNQGENIHLGDVEVFVDRVMTTLIKREGCSSQELISEVVDLVTVDCRTFIPDEITFQREGIPKETIKVPFGFMPSLFKERKCECCNQTLPKRSR